MRVNSPTLLFIAMTLSLTVLFQNCGGQPTLSAQHSLASVAGPTDPYTLQNVTVVVAGASQAPLNFESHGINFPEITLDIGGTGTTNPVLSTEPLPTTVHYATQEAVCTNTAGAPANGLPVTNLEASHGVFLTGTTSEMFLYFASSTTTTSGASTIWDDINFQVFERKSGISSSVFQAAICHELSGAKGGAGVGTTSP